ncbi:MAG: Hsp70 family protein [Dactylosporangium sp.]|nr:Hsp70 family protein [Dactylosporangium sp.]NNJ62123.1 Hsp70 family protein [Dactylosporangium sp.]
MLTVPGGWGPRRQALLRQAAVQAGLPHPRTVPVPVAVALHWQQTSGLQVGADQWVLVYDLGDAAFTASVVALSPTDDLVLATADLPGTGLGALDDQLLDGCLQALAEHRPGLAAALAEPGTPADRQARHRMAGQVRHARHRLDAAATAIVASPVPEVSITVTREKLDALLDAQVRQVGASAQRVVAAADVDPADCAGRLVAGPGAVQGVLVGRLEVVVGSGLVVCRPAAAADGALWVPPDPSVSAPVPAAGRPRLGWRFDLRQYLGAIVAIVGAFLLLATTLVLADIDISPSWGTRTVRTEPGGYALAAAFAAIATVNMVLPTLDIPPPPTPRTMLLGGAAAALTLAGLLAILVSGRLGLPLSQTVWWTLPAVVPIGLAVGMLAAASGCRRPPDPQQIAGLRFPITVTVAVTVSVLAIDVAYHTVWVPVPHEVPARAAAIVFGLATAALITPKPAPIPLRLFTGFTVAIIFAMSIALNATTALAAGFLVIADLWWLLRAGRILVETMKASDMRLPILLRNTESH